MLRFIGGPSRCGKSTVAHQVQAICGGQALSQDNLRQAFMSLADAKIKEGLSVTPKINAHSSAEWLDIVRARDRLLWRGTRAYIEAALANSEHDVLIEGDLWSDYIAELSAEYQAVFLVDTGLSHVDRVLAIAHSHETGHNWMSDWTDEQLKTWALYNIERSKLTKQLANQYGHRAFDIADHGLSEAQARAVEYLAPPDL